MPKLPEYAQWQAPWEKTGDDFVAETARKYIYDLHRDLETKTDAVAAEKTKAREAEKAQSDLQSQLDAKVSTENSDVDKLTRELASANKKLSDREAADRDRSQKALMVALDIDGITARQAKALAPLLSGNDEDELKTAATTVIETLGLKIGDGTDDTDDKGDPDSIRMRGETLRTKGDPEPDTYKPGRKGNVIDQVNELFPVGSF